MAPETYYFFFSIILVIAVALHIINMIHFRLRHRTLFGVVHKLSNNEKKRLAKYSSTPYMAATTFIFLLAIANLLYNIHRLLNFDDQSHARGLLFYAPVATIILLIIAFIKGYKYFENSDKSDTGK